MLDRETKRNRKVARTLIRLRHSLAADEEIQEYLEDEKIALANGNLVRIDTSLKELLDKS